MIESRTSLKRKLAAALDRVTRLVDIQNENEAHILRLQTRNVELHQRLRQCIRLCEIANKNSRHLRSQIAMAADKKGKI